MDSPNIMANIRIGVEGSIVPFGVKCNKRERWPSWKTKTRTPNITDKESRFMAIAFKGKSTEPKAIKSSKKVASTTTSTIHGSVWPISVRVSAKSALWPPT